MLPNESHNLQRTLMVRTVLKSFFLSFLELFKSRMLLVSAPQEKGKGGQILLSHFFAPFPKTVNINSSFLEQELFDLLANILSKNP